MMKRKFNLIKQYMININHKELFVLHLILNHEYHKDVQVDESFV